MTGFRIFFASHIFSTRGQVEFIDLTDKVREVVAESGIRNGLVHVFAPHATGILILTENEHGLLEDFKTFLQELVPQKEGYHHPSNAHAHLRSILLPPEKTLPVTNGTVEFGTWQSLMFVETDVHPRRRSVTLQVLGER